MNGLRVWFSTRRFPARVVGLVLLIAGGLTVALVVFGDDAVIDSAPVLAVFVATMSLVVTAAGAVATWQRQKRESTIKAWIDWSDSRLESRRTAQRCFGSLRIRPDQATSLVADVWSLTNKDRQALGDVECVQVGNAVVHILNGLERLATGANLGVYDVKTLKALGGTTIVATYNRFKPYIHARRSAEDEDLRQANAYVELQWLVAEIDRGNLLHHRRELDQARLQRVQARR